MRHKDDLLGIFARHKVAPNLLMALMILSGFVALKLLNVQFFPDSDPDTISVGTLWSGASAEDIETTITTPLEQRIRNIDRVKEIRSTSASGVSGITVELDKGADKLLALDRIQKEIDSFGNMPADAEDTKVSLAERYESVARLLISGPGSIDELKTLAYRFESELLAKGIDRVDLTGLPKTHIEIAIAPEQLVQSGLSLDQISQRIRQFSQDQPAGLVGQEQGTRELRSLGKRRTVDEFADLDIVSTPNEQVKLGDIATLTRASSDLESFVTVEGKLAVVLTLRRNANGNSLVSARILHDWLDATLPTLPPNIVVKPFGERWTLIMDRINLMLKNGSSGLALVLFTLFLFLSGRVAFWVAVGIPVSFMATLAVLYLAGGSINMLSLFALIMALGIIVDDAIVVAEDAQAHFEMGEDRLSASEGGARRMLGPVMASSLTTVAAFLPLMLIGGHMGAIMFSIPLVIVAVIIASLIESFLILPGHLRHAFKKTRINRRHGIRAKLDGAFEHFKNKLFRPFLYTAIAYRWATIAIALGVLLFAVGLFLGGRISWVFFPSPESTNITANVRFVAGTPTEKTDLFLNHLETTLRQTKQELEQNGDWVVDTWYVVHRSSSGRGRAIRGDRIGSIFVELTAPDSRSVPNNTFVKTWRDKVVLPSGVESFTLAARRTGPSAKDLEVRMAGSDADSLKSAATELSEALKGIDGVSAVDDDLAYGREQYIYELTANGRATGLTLSGLNQQLRAAYDGLTVQRFQEGREEIDVRVQLPASTRERLSSLPSLPILLPNGEYVPFESIARWSTRQGFENLRHAGGELAVTVSANVDAAVGNVQSISNSVAATTLPTLAARYGVQYSLEGGAQHQRDTLSDLQLGLIIGLTMIYIILTWVFSSYGWPILVMLIIPFGITGAVLGHWLMGMNFTLLSLFGLFGLSGIVINDSIILVTFYKQLRSTGLAAKDALVEASCQRLRAVLLTSITTIAGLAPLLFETSRQAQFLIPMAVSIAFGLGFATILILVLLPSILSIYESAHDYFFPAAHVSSKPPLEHAV